MSCIAMGRTFSILAIFAVALGSRPAPAQDTLVAEEVHIAVVHETIVVNGARFSMPMDRPRLLRVLGEPDREVKLANTLLTWDDLGLVAYQNPQSGKITALAIAFDQQKFEFWPKRLFRGSLRFDAATITADSTLGEINRAKEGSLFARDDVLPGNFTIRHKRTSYYLEAVDPKKTEGPNVTFASLQICERLTQQ